MTIRFDDTNTMAMAGDIIAAGVGGWSALGDERQITVEEVEQIAQALLLWVTQQKQNKKEAAEPCS